MDQPFATIEAAFATLADPLDPNWGSAFALLAARPETADLMIETFRETLEQMGVAPTGTDPATGQPSFALADIARALGVPEADLDSAVVQAGRTEELGGS